MSGAAHSQMLRDGLDELGLDASLADPLLNYLDLLVRWNATYNLTAVRDRRQMVTRHLLDSLSLAPWVKGRLLDVGTGAGLPGIPLAISQPSLEVTLLDSAGKKVRFLNHVQREMKLSNIQPLQARVESYQCDEPFDGICSRAFSSLAAFVAGVRHLCGAETRLLAMKGRRPDDELEALPKDIEVRAIHRLNVPGLQQDRHLVIMSVTDSPLNKSPE